MIRQDIREREGMTWSRLQGGIEPDVHGVPALPTEQSGRPILMIFLTNIYDPKRMNPTDF